MAISDILVPTAIMALLRGDETVQSVAAQCGVSEAEVEKWRDVFVVSGVLALSEFLSLPGPRGPLPDYRTTTTTTYPPSGYPTTPESPY